MKSMTEDEEFVEKAAQLIIEKKHETTKLGAYLNLKHTYGQLAAEAIIENNLDLANKWAKRWKAAEIAFEKE